MVKTTSGTGQGRKGLPKPNRAAKLRREDRVVLLTNLGYWPDQIAQSLEPPISETTVFQDRSARKNELIGPTRGHRRRPWPPPEKYDWMTDPEPEPLKRSHWITGPVPRLQSLLDWLRDNNARNQFSFNVADAIKANDSEFLTEVKGLIGELSGYLDDLGNIIASDDARKAATTLQARDDLKVDPAAPRAWSDPGGEKPMPSFGSGTIPTRVHAGLWQEWWAGRDILSPEVLSKIATREACPPQRVRRAAAEMLAVLRRPA